MGNSIPVRTTSRQSIQTNKIHIDTLDRQKRRLKHTESLVKIPLTYQVFITTNR